MALAERVWAKVDRSGGPESCWLWTGCKLQPRRPTSRSDYGRVYVDGKAWNTHRLVWTLTNGPIPDGLKVLHRCDTPPCCNPAHLFLGTQANNVADMVAKGRQRHGEWYRPLKKKPGTWRLKSAPGRALVAELATAYGLSEDRVSRIFRTCLA